MPTGQLGFELMQSDVQRQEPSLQASSQAAFATDNQQFALDIYRQLSSEPGNFFYSPYSMSTALAMAYVGAKGTTKTEMGQAMQFLLPDAELHPAFNALDTELGQREVAPSDDSVGLTLQTHNDIWAHVDEDKRPLQSYVDSLAANYAAAVKLVDFDEAEAARSTINSEVSRQTHDTVQELIPTGVIVPQITTMVLTNTIYFKAAWKTPFEEALTSTGVFSALDATPHDVDMMQIVERFEYATGADFAAVRLPYAGNLLALTVVLPNAGKFEAVEQALSPDLLSTLATQFEFKTVDLKLPKFDMRSNFSLKTTLKALGMLAAFEPDEADFSDIGPHQVYIQDVLHEAFISLDETGTEAGAATAVVFGDESAGPQPEVTFVADRPFVLLLEDVPTRTLLFAGRVVAPE